MRRKVLASALSVLLVTTSVPVPAIAEGIDDVQPVAIEQAAAPEEAADEAADGEQVPADDTTEAAADEATAPDAGEAVVDEATETENVIAAEEPAAEATDEAEGADAEAASPADAADTAAATPSTQAAGDPYETEAPAFDLNKVVGTVLSYTINAGSLKPARHGMDPDKIPTDMIESISEPVHNERGGWDIIVTLKAGTAADYGVPEGYLRGFDADELVIDPTAETNMQFTVSTYSASSTTWQCFANQKAKFTFVPASEVVPTANADDLAAVSNSVNYSMQRAEGGAYGARTSIGSTENIESIGEVYKNSDGAWAVDVTLKSDADPADYGLDNEVATQGKPYKLDAESSKLVATFVWTNGPLGYSWKCNGANQAKLVFKEVTAPAFDINNELNVYGTVRYQLNKADDTTYEDNTHLVSADNIASVGIPYQTEDGCWAVDVTLKDTATPDDYEVPNLALGDGAWKLDTNASDLTMTFRTLSPEGTTWYCSGADRANLVFAEQADEPGENPGEDTENPGEDTEKPGTGTGTEQPGDDTKVPVTDDAQDKGNASDNQAKDTQEAAADEDTLTQTGDPADGLAVIAAGGVLAVVAGIELKRRSAGERL